MNAYKKTYYSALENKTIAIICLSKRLIIVSFFSLTFLSFGMNKGSGEIERQESLSLCEDEQSTPQHRLQHSSACTELHMSFKRDAESAQLELPSSKVIVQEPSVPCPTPQWNKALSKTLIECIKSHDASQVELLLIQNACPHSMSADGSTALQVARDATIIRLLIEAGANPNTFERRGESHLSYLINQNGSCQAIEALIDGGASLNGPISRLSSFAPIHTAMMRNYTAAVRLLIKKGANPMHLMKTDDALVMGSPILEMIKDEVLFRLFIRASLAKPTHEQLLIFYKDYPLSRDVLLKNSLAHTQRLTHSNQISHEDIQEACVIALTRGHAQEDNLERACMELSLPLRPLIIEALHNTVAMGDLSRTAYLLQTFAKKSSSSSHENIWLMEDELNDLLKIANLNGHKAIASIIMFESEIKNKSSRLYYLPRDMVTGYLRLFVHPILPSLSSLNT